MRGRTGFAEYADLILHDGRFNVVTGAETRRGMGWLASQGGLSPMTSVLIMQQDPQGAEHLRRQVELLGHEAIVAESVADAIRILLDSNLAAATAGLDVETVQVADQAADDGDRSTGEAEAIGSVLIEAPDMREAARVGEVGGGHRLREHISDASPWSTGRAWLTAVVSHYHVPLAMVCGAIATLLLLWVGQAIWGGENVPQAHLDRYDELIVNTIKKAPRVPAPKRSVPERSPSNVAPESPPGEQQTRSNAAPPTDNIDPW